MSTEVRFIRKNGRIIPIRSKGSKSVKKAVRKQRPTRTIDKPAVQAAIFSSAGIGLAGAGGFLSGRVVKSADQMSQTSFDYLIEKKGVKLPKRIKTVGHGFQVARRRSKFGFKSKTLIGIASTAALSLGITKLIESFGANKPTLKQEAGREFAAVTTSTVLLTAFAKGSGLPRPKIRIPDSVKRTAGDLATAFIKKQLRFKL